MNRLSEALIDRFLIREVIDRYAYALDARDWDLLATCFHEDVRYSLVAGRVQLASREEVLRRLRSVERWTSTHHGISNANIAVAGDAAIAVIHSVVFLHRAGEPRGATKVRGLRYEDKFIRAGEEWRIARRAHIPIWQFDAATEPPEMPAAMTATS